MLCFNVLCNVGLLGSFSTYNANPSLKGETGRNAYTRGLEHLKNLEAKNLDKSVLWLHTVHHHQGREGIPYTMKVTGSFQEPLDRQIMERVRISRFEGPVLMNRKNEMGGLRVERMQYRRWGEQLGGGSWQGGGGRTDSLLVDSLSLNFQFLTRSL